MAMAAGRVAKKVRTVADVVGRKRESAVGNGRGVEPWLGRRGRVTGRETRMGTPRRERVASRGSRRLPVCYVNTRVQQGAHVRCSTRFRIRRALQAPTELQVPAHCPVPLPAGPFQVPLAQPSPPSAMHAHGPRPGFRPCWVPPWFIIPAPSFRIRSTSRRSRDPVPSYASPSVSSLSSQPVRVQSTRILLVSLSSTSK